ncbi:MAG TPA: class I SAM-dependent methyltransferase [Gaiellaceae bacterium]|nr:class I SAM-dependent methyltransferase [Gaiellaceae bacterium]
MSSPDVSANVAAWTRRNAEYLDGASKRAWAREEICWGMFEVPESELGVLGDVAGLDVVELGCGTAYFSARLARLGARGVGVDPTRAQLETARRRMTDTGIEFLLVEAPGERVPLPDASFDLAFSEHGAATWADPYRWIPEAARLLRPGGRLLFLHSTPLAELCYPPVGEITRELQRPYFDMHRFVWTEDSGVEFQLTHGDWIAVLRSAGFEIERLVELQAPADARKHEYYGADVPPEWARQWPAEEIWVARKA